MPTATLHLDNLGGWAGYTRLYRIDPPKYFDGMPCDYVAVSLVRGSRYTDGEVMVIAATEQGVALDGTVRRRVGSRVLETDPNSPAAIEAVFTQAMDDLGGYAIESEG